mmetsp:Transcript_54614/g.155463  ORF Transcript_54614/g.155463 Transcript_54614/m.155463 type:complete len:298 (+) Transcript_54614:1-894(+)
MGLVSSHDGASLAKHAAGHAAHSAASGAKDTVTVADTTSHQAVTCISQSGSLVDTAGCAGKEAAKDGASAADSEVHHTVKKDTHRASVVGHMSMDVVKQPRKLQSSSFSNVPSLFQDAGALSRRTPGRFLWRSVREALSRMTNITEHRFDISNWAQHFPVFFERTGPHSSAARASDRLLLEAAGTIDLDYVVTRLDGTDAEKVRNSLQQCELKDLTAEIVESFQGYGESEYAVVVNNHTAYVVHQQALEVEGAIAYLPFFSVAVPAAACVCVCCLLYVVSVRAAWQQELRQVSKLHA